MAKEVATKGAQEDFLHNDVLALITDESTADDIAKLLSQLNDGRGVLEAVDAVGDGCRFIKDKDALVKEPFVILDWRILTTEKEQDNGELKETEYCTVRAWSPKLGKISFVDTSGYGVKKQLMDASARGITGGIHCPKGLEKREFTSKATGDKAKSYSLAI